ncbi:MAG: glycosyltransferase family 4 protein [Bacteroidales bacterium]|nr:glycosyltransferase family 4 protein [Bacteroidales bacterium]
MRIAINTRLLLKGKMDGIGWFSYETIRRMVIQHPEHEFLFIFDRKFDSDFIFAENVSPIVVSPPARHPFLYIIWFEIMLPFVLKKYKADVFLSPDGFLSLNTKVKSIAVMHDLNFEHYPADLPKLHAWHYRRYFPKYAKKADRIATVSEYSKADIANIYNINPEKIDVVYNGAGEIFKPINAQAQQQIRERFSDGNEYFVFVGTLHPRKNLVNLFKAFDQFKDNTNNQIKLVIVGAKMWWTPEIKQTYENMRFRDQVVFTGRLPGDELSKVVASALAMVYVSYFEGFGIPILEAFMCETAVITSNITSMPEVAGDAAMLVDPFDVCDIADAMRKLVETPGLREQLLIKSAKQRQLFSWEKSAEKLWDCIMKTTV